MAQASVNHRFKRLNLPIFRFHIDMVKKPLKFNYELDSN